ncbi:LOW QUALITY PROTEIN: BRCA1-associated protein-like [Liolophura sinensis]|uniref:LOW QUALITY PROTEIN: BRCA1-associated protein-like n=1 Tax=Liolophura sinensis TaxID=3198878 RepID=UPI00315827F6
MSVSLLVLRLEVADDSITPKSFAYQAPKFIMTSEKKHEAGSRNQRFGPDDVPSETQNLDKYIGQRKMQDVTIETIVNEGPDTDEKTVQLVKCGTGGKSDSSYASVVSSISTEDSQQVRDFNTNSAASNTAEEVSTRPQSTFTRPKRSRSADRVTARKSQSQTRGGSVEVGYSPMFPDDSHASMHPGSGIKRPQSHSPLPKGPGTIYFFSGNPMVEVTKGLLHIYKDNQLTPLNEDIPRSEMVCILTVPAAFTIHDVLQFTAAVHSGVEFMRIIRDSSPNQYMLLIKFRNQTLADEFYSNYNGIPFNSIEDYVCHLVYVAKVESVKAGEGACLPVPGLTELPNCPVCLERMDEAIDGILTILCNHSFHISSCLSQWGDTSCPVCRYCQTPEEVADNRCIECGSQESLWICLICGHVGCGRYVARHAFRHFQETQHTYAMQLGSNRVWDYTGDNYVHRLVQNKTDGKLVQVDEGGNFVQEEKLTSLTLEYTYLLTNQLESQRLYFEEKMKNIEQVAQEQVLDTEARYKETKKHSEFLENKVDQVTKEKQIAEKKGAQLHSRLTSVLTELRDEKEMNKGLLENQQAWQKRVNSLETKVQELTASKEEEIEELREQLRDVMFYLEAQQKLSSTKEVSQTEIQEGQIIVGAAAEESPSPRGKRGRKKGR